MEEFSLIQIFIGALALMYGVLRLDPAAFAAAQIAPAGVVLTVLFLAGLSDVLGQSMTLLANRVKPGRFVISIIASIAALIFSVFFWALSIWIAAALLYDGDRSYVEVLSDVSLSYAPLIFGIFVFLPYLGNFIYRILRIWVFLALLVGVQAAYGFTFFQALVCTFLGWLVYEAITRFPVVRPDRLSRWWWRVTTGTPEPVDIQAKADELAEQGRLLLYKTIPGTKGDN